MKKKTERLMDQVVEDRMVNFILKQASENDLTISHIRIIADKAIHHLERNAVLKEEVEDLSRD